MNLRQIEVFRAVMQAGSVIGAARLLGVSQPAVSRLLRHTEDVLGFPLFDRRAGRLVPTPEAETLYAEADVALRGMRRVGDLAKALATGEGSTLRIAASPSLGSVVLARALALFVRRHPGVDVDIVTLAHPAVVDRIVLRQAELGLSQFAADHPGIVQERLVETPLLLALPDGSPLAQHAVVPLAALEGLPLISYPAASPVGALVRTHFSRHGMVLRAAVTVRYPMIACFFVEAGIGAAIVDAFVVLDRAAWRFAVRRFEPAPSSEIWALHGSARPLSHNARDFLRAVRQVLRDAS